MSVAIRQGPAGLAHEVADSRRFPSPNGLLTASQEVELAKRIEAGEEAARRLQTGVRSGNGQEELRRRVAAGKEAKAAFITANLGLVVARTRSQADESRTDFLDLVQEGNLGLIRAVEKYEWRKGFKFSSYATWWIGQAVTWAIASKSRTVRLPLRLHRALIQVNAAKPNLRVKLGRDPFPNEIAKGASLPIQDVEEVLRITDTLSLEQPVGEDGTRLGDYLKDNNAAHPDEIAEKQELNDRLYELVDRLPRRERLILKQRYGLGDGVPRTFKEIGEHCNLSAERVRQLERRALCRLRHPSFGLIEADFV